MTTISYLMIYFLSIYNGFTIGNNEINNNIHLRLEGIVISQSYINLKIGSTDNLPKDSASILLLRKEMALLDLGISNHKTDSVISLIDIDEAEVIYKGKIAIDSLQVLSFNDYDVTPAHSYVYWIIDEKRNIKSGPLCLKVRDPKLWWSQELIDQKIEKLSFAYPDLVNKVVIGKTVNGQDINALVIGNDKNAIALIGNTHAAESGGELITYTATELLKNNQNLLKDIGLLIIPVLNIDSRNKMIEGRLTHIRKNANQVDLNRNYEVGWSKVQVSNGKSSDDPKSFNYRGKTPNSEPETKAVISFFEQYRPCLVMAFHWMNCITGTRIHFSPSKDDSYDVDVKLAYEYIKGFMNVENDDEISEYVSGNPIPGSIRPYCSEILNIPSFVLEGRRNNEIERRAFFDHATPADLVKYQKKHYQALLNLMEYMSRSGNK